MAIAINFSSGEMNAAQYDECIQRLEIAGANAPEGRSFHACYGSGNELRVFDVWDSKQSFEKFAQTLIPILKDIGIESGEPEIYEVHKVIKG